MVLPAESTLRCYKNCVTQQPGTSFEMFMWMRKEADRHNVSEAGRHGGLILDEMSIQDDIQVMRKEDRWNLLGDRNVGPVLNNITIIMAGKKEVKMATHVLQCIFAGSGGFRWPIAYYATTTAITHQLITIIWDLVDSLSEYDFSVDYVMFDGASANRSCINHMCPNPRDHNFTVTNIYDDGKQITLVQDAKHCLKKIRNNVESSRANHRTDKGRLLLYKGKEILWHHWEGAHSFNSVSGVRIHHKLTSDHINLTSISKMRNHLALEVLDRNMLYLMIQYGKARGISDELSGTIAVLEQTSVLVDIFMDTNRSIISQDDRRLTQLTESLKFFNEWEMEVNQQPSLVAAKNLMTKETRDDLNGCIVGFMEVCKRWIAAAISVRPGYFNSDVVENFFCQQRGLCNGMNTNPTLSQYGPGVNAIIVGQNTLSRKANSSGAALPFNATTPKPLQVRKPKRPNNL